MNERVIWRKRVAGAHATTRISWHACVRSGVRSVAAEKGVSSANNLDKTRKKL